MFEEQRNQIQGSKSAHLEFAHQEYACATTNRIERGLQNLLTFVEGAYLTNQDRENQEGSPQIQ